MTIITNNYIDAPWLLVRGSLSGEPQQAIQTIQTIPLAILPIILHADSLSILLHILCVNLLSVLLPILVTNQQH
jgi:hypothetical protein